jgi:hypothetical protein
MEWLYINIQDIVPHNCKSYNVWDTMDVDFEVFN